MAMAAATYIGGTSCAAPLWAGFMALVNQQAVGSGKASAGFINPAIYTIAAGSSYAACFHDVTTGNNTWPSSPNLFYATNGYDLCTGLGTPAGQNLINALAGPLDMLVITPRPALPPAAQPVRSMSPPKFFHYQFECGFIKVDARQHIAVAQCHARQRHDCFPRPKHRDGEPEFRGFQSGGGNLLRQRLVHQSDQRGGARPAVCVASLPAVGCLANQRLSSSGPVGGPFVVTKQNFSLTNMGTVSLNWSVNSNASWLSASPNGGALAAGGQTTLTVSLNSTANSLAAGTYNANTVITNQKGGTVVLPFILLVGQPLVQNGGFEAGTFTNWTQSGNTNYNSSYTYVTSGDSEFVHSGTYGAELGPYGSLGYLSQTLPTFAGQNYLLSLWLDSPNVSGTLTPNEFSVSWNGGVIFDHQTSAKSGGPICNSSSRPPVPARFSRSDSGMIPITSGLMTSTCGRFPIHPSVP